MLSSPSGECYPIENGIPRFVKGVTYADNFGSQWNEFRLTQLDSYTKRPITRDRIRRCMGEALWNDLHGKHVLECGCGAGRFTEVLLERGAFVMSVDLSSAVDANAANFPVSDRHRIAQADILRLPFAKGQFDVVVCLGVIQHTPDPERAIAALYEQVNPGGTLVIDHYTFTLGRITSTKPLFRYFLKRQPRDKAMAAVERLVDVFLPWHKRLRASRLGWFLLCRISPVTTYYKSAPDLDETLQREWALLDTHDSLTDWFKHLRSREQIRRALQALGLEGVWCEYGGNGVEARGRRPCPERTFQASAERADTGRSPSSTRASAG
jgi:SAM-dependent methyltransferase